MLKIKYIWFLNLALFAGVVFLGIEQAGKGATLSNLENEIETSSVTKRELTEKIFRSESGDKIAGKALELGYNKPTQVYYFKTIDAVASLK